MIQQKVPVQYNVDITFEESFITVSKVRESKCNVLFLRPLA